MAEDAAHTPRRIQRKRMKGWRIPEGAIYVGRPSKWGNPFVVGGAWDVASVVAIYRQWLLNYYNATGLPPKPNLSQLRGKDLVCWCPLDQPCHADVLLEFANAT